MTPSHTAKKERADSPLDKINCVRNEYSIGGGVHMRQDKIVLKSVTEPSAGSVETCFSKPAFPFLVFCSALLCLSMRLKIQD